MTTDPAIQDPLVALRRAIAAGSLPTPTTDPDPTVQDPSRATDDLSAATHLFFREPAPQTVPLTAATRFVSSSSDSAVDLRSIFFAWQKKDVAIPEYIASATELNEALKEKPPQPSAGEEGAQSPVQVQNLVFVERLDLITWLEGASDDSEYIKPLEGAAAAAVAAAAAAEAAADAASAQAQASANIASGAAGGVSAVTGAGAPPAAVQAPAGAGGAGGAGRAAAKTIDPRLQEIYNGERKMGDRNSVLRGIKPTDFSHVRKTAEAFLGRSRTRPGQGATSSNSNAKQVSGGKTPLVPNPSSGLPMPKKHGSGHSNPIILLSPSASSLIRMTNVKSFLQDGVFVPPDHPTLSMSTSPNILEIQRPVGGGSSASGPGAAAAAASSQSTSNSSDRLRRRFTLVDSTANFRPEYWSRLVAVFTTGQTWQFKSYKWSSPPELFKHASGIYVGWRGEDPPREVKGWGRGVEKFAVERWDERGGGVHGAGRWMDREVVEGIWRVIEDGMKIRGWAR